MTTRAIFRQYSAADREACLGLFDANCPEFFAPNERSDYAEFLDEGPTGYEVCLADERIVGAYGLTGDELTYRRLNWILINNHHMIRAQVPLGALAFCQTSPSSPGDIKSPGDEGLVAFVPYPPPMRNMVQRIIAAAEGRG